MRVRLQTLRLAQAVGWLDEAHARRQRVGLVPTMGALHDGHLTLVRRAVAENDVVCVSVFVNPLQFDDPTDLASYPRDLEADAARVHGAGAAMVFSGSLADFFPGAASAEDVALVDAGPAAHGLEGEHRVGHFDGVATIVARLLEIVRPRAAYFGEKDFQQTLVVRHIAGATKVVVCPTKRADDGLAMSSRNARLHSEARAKATCLWRALQAARAAWRAGERDALALTQALALPLQLPGVEVEYAQLRDPEAWQADAPLGRMTRARALVAARVGNVRLIDNLRLDEVEQETSHE